MRTKAWVMLVAIVGLVSVLLYGAASGHMGWAPGSKMATNSMKLAKIPESANAIKSAMKDMYSAHGRFPVFLDQLNGVVDERDMRESEQYDDFILRNDGEFAFRIKDTESSWVLYTPETGDGGVRYHCSRNFRAPGIPGLYNPPCIFKNFAIEARRGLSGGKGPCPGADSESEAFICQNQRLSSRSDKIQKLVNEIREKYPKARGEIKQQQWLDRRASRCPPFEKDRTRCFRELLTERKESLKEMRAFYKDNSGSPD